MNVARLWADMHPRQEEAETRSICRLAFEISSRVSMLNMVTPEQVLLVPEGENNTEVSVWRVVKRMSCTRNVLEYGEVFEWRTQSQVWRSTQCWHLYPLYCGYSSTRSLACVSRSSALKPCAHITLAKTAPSSMVSLLEACIK